MNGRTLTWTALLVIGSSGLLAAQPLRSTAPAQALVDLLKARGTEAAGAPDPASAERFTAALLVGGNQLLVVSATHPSRDLLVGRVARGEFRDLYLDLQGTPTAAGKWFLMDGGADGLRASPGPDGSFDILYEEGTKTTMFNGNWKGQGRDESTYRRQVEEADARYAELLEALASALRAPSPTTH